MDRTHETYLTDVLHDVYRFGAARLPYHLLYRWFDAERLSKKVWANIAQKWADLLDENQDKDGWRLAYVDNGQTDFITFICLDPKDATESHFRALETPPKPFTFEH